VNRSVKFVFVSFALFGAAALLFGVLGACLFDWGPVRPSAIGQVILAASVFAPIVFLMACIFAKRLTAPHCLVFSTVLGIGLPIMVLVFLTVGSGWSEGYCLWFPHIDTVKAPGYTAEKWDAVRVGMSRDEVRSVLGEPLGVSDKAWQYTRDGRSPVLDFAWEMKKLYFSPDGSVTSKQSRWFFD